MRKEVQLLDCPKILFEQDMVELTRIEKGCCLFSDDDVIAAGLQNSLLDILLDSSILVDLERHPFCQWTTSISFID
jgi:hypothetical protein